MSHCNILKLGIISHISNHIKWRKIQIQALGSQGESSRYINNSVLSFHFLSSLDQCINETDT